MAFVLIEITWHLSLEKHCWQLIIILPNLGLEFSVPPVFLRQVWVCSFCCKIPENTLLKYKLSKYTSAPATPARKYWVFPCVNIPRICVSVTEQEPRAQGCHCHMEHNVCSDQLWLSRAWKRSGIVKNASVQGEALLSDGILSPSRALLGWWGVRWWVTPHLGASWAAASGHTGGWRWLQSKHHEGPGRLFRRSNPSTCPTAIQI